jgi:hypothetical protein
MSPGGTGALSPLPQPGDVRLEILKREPHLTHGTEPLVF